MSVTVKTTLKKRITGDTFNDIVSEVNKLSVNGNDSLNISKLKTGKYYTVLEKEYSGSGQEETTPVQPRLQTLTVTENGTYTPESGYDGFNTVSVDVPEVVREVEVLDEERKLIQQALGLLSIGLDDPPFKLNDDIIVNLIYRGPVKRNRFFSGEKDFSIVKNFNTLGFMYVYKHNNVDILLCRDEINHQYYVFKPSDNGYFKSKTIIMPTDSHPMFHASFLNNNFIGLYLSQRLEREEEDTDFHYEYEKIYKYNEDLEDFEVIQPKISISQLIGITNNYCFGSFTDENQYEYYVTDRNLNKLHKINHLEFDSDMFYCIFIELNENTVCFLEQRTTTYDSYNQDNNLYSLKLHIFDISSDWSYSSIELLQNIKCSPYETRSIVLNNKIYLLMCERNYLNEIISKPFVYVVNMSDFSVEKYDIPNIPLLGGNVNIIDNKIEGQFFTLEINDDEKILSEHLYVDSSLWPIPAKI